MTRTLVSQVTHTLETPKISIVQHIYIDTLYFAILCIVSNFIFLETSNSSVCQMKIFIL